MPKRWPLTPKNFDALLAWLDADREQAAEKYEAIRESLIKIFAWRGLGDAEGLADETINRVAAKVKEIGPTYVGDPAWYFYGVAKNVINEALREAEHYLPLPEDMAAPSSPTEDSEADERMHQCLEECLKTLSSENLELFMRYYSLDKQAKIDMRKELAQELGIA